MENKNYSTIAKTVLITAYLIARKFFLFLFLIMRRIVSPSEGSIKRILILRYDRIGDMVLSTPLFKSLKKHIPGCQIIVLASRKNQEVLYHNPYVDEIVVYQGIVKFIRDFRHKDIDLAIDSFYTYELKPAFLAFLSGAKYRVGFEEAGRELFFNLKGPRLYPFKQMTYHLLDLLIPLGIYEEKAQQEIYLTDAEVNCAKEYFAGKNFKSDDLKIAVSPGAYYPSQKWPAERFAELIQKISEKFNTRVILFTDKGEETLREKIINLLGPNGGEFLHGLNLRQFMAYLSQCHLLICNNSGPMHIAGGLKIPTVSIIGPTQPDLWWPLGADQRVINKNVPCSPCNRGVCRNHSCMNLVSRDEVFEAIEQQVHKIQSGIKDKIINEVPLRIQGIKKILIINLGGIGDILLSSIALKALRKAYADTKIYLLAIPRVAEFAASWGYFDRVFIFHKTLGLLKNLKTSFILKKEKIDLAINMRTLVSKTSAGKMKLLLNLIKPKVSCGRNTEGRGYFFDIGIPESSPGEKYEMLYDIDTIKALGVREFEQNLILDVNSSAENRINDLLAHESVGREDTLIGINPAAGSVSKIWPLENFAAAITIIAKEINCKFVATCTSHEAAQVERLSKMIKEPLVVMSKLSFQELVALIKRCDVYISNDTGPMHIAAILKTPLLAIFGPGSITRFDPRNISDKVIMLHKDVNCAPCNRVTCKSLKCLKGILPQEVADGVLFLLNTNKPKN